MPKCYVLYQFNVTDPETFARYRISAAQFVRAHGGNVLVGGTTPDVQEGSLPANLATILEFPSKEAAEGWYNSPEYSAIKHFRTESTSSGSLAFLEGFVPPPPSTS